MAGRSTQTNAQVFAAAHVLDVRARLAVDRLLYAQRVFAIGSFFSAECDSSRRGDIVEDSWLAGLKADLQWMHAVNPDWSADMTSLVDIWQTKGSFWNAQVKAVPRKHQFQER